MTQRRYAYLIGANGPPQTQITPLQYAEQDVERLEQAFAMAPCQFAAVQRVIANATIDVVKEFEEFTENCQNTDLLIVHFSGHAKSENRELYLIRNDTIFPPHGRLRVSTTIKLRDIKDILDRCRARQKLLILDCCYSGTAIGYKGNDEVEEALEQLKGSTTAILTACSFREKARELDSLNNGQGGGFLSWIISSACTDHFDRVAKENALSLMDVWNWLNKTALSLVNKDLPRKELIPSPHLLNDLVAGADNEIWFTDKRHTSDSDTFLAEQRQREELVLLQQEGFLGQYCSNASVEDFDLASVQEYAKLQPDSNRLPMQNIRELCKRLGFTSGQYTPRRSSVLAFHPMPGRYIPSALVRVTMRGVSSDEPYIRDDIEGSLNDQVERALKWLKTNLNIVSENVDGGQRLDRCEIPDRVLREVVVNAILHRNYEAHESVHIEITLQHVVFTNPGQLNQVIENAKPPFSYQHSHPQNPELLRILVAQRWAEGRSLGFKIIKEECEKYSLPLPVIRNLPGSLVQVVIQRPDLSIISQVNEKEALENQVLTDSQELNLFLTVHEEEPMRLYEQPQQGLVIKENEGIYQHFSPPIRSDLISVFSSRQMWMVPYARNPFFTGREEVLENLHERFERGQAQAVSQPQAMSGLGGIGKTQIAVEYAYRYREAYQQVLWASAETVELLNMAYTQIATKLDLPEKGAQEQEMMVEAVKQWLGEHEQWLLILDNADEPEALEAFLPPMVGGHVLVTTRASDLTTLGLGFGHGLEVETFKVEQGAQFLLHRAGLLALDAELDQAKAEDRQRAMELSQELGGLPLALDQAGAYIIQTQCTLMRYQQFYQTHRKHLLNERRGKKEHPDSVATTWKLSFERVEAMNAAAAELLRLCSFLAPDAIPEWMLSKGVEQVGPLLAPMVADAYLLDQAVEILRGYSLLKRDVQAGMLSMHRLVQAVVRDAMTEEEEHAWKQRVMLLLRETCPDVSKFEEWPLCEQWVSHVLVSVRWLEEAALQTEVAAWVCNAAGYYLYARGRYQEAEPLSRRALEISEQELGPGHPDTATSLNNLAELYRAQGKYAEAEPLMKRALEIREQALGPGHPDTAQSLNNLAELYRAQGKYAEAEPLSRRALEIREQELGPRHPDTAQSLNNLALLYYAQGKYGEAEPLYTRALEIREQELGPRHPDTALSLNNLAALYDTQGKYAEAEPLYQRALEIWEQELGPRHPDTALSLNNLAVLYRAQGKYAEAEPLYQRALEIREQELGPRHPDTALSLNNLAALYRAQGKYAEAEPLYQRALEIWEQELGPRHPDTALSLNNLAFLYQAQGKYAEAEPLYKRALGIWEQSLGPTHPSTSMGRDNYAELLRELGREEEVAALEMEGD